MDLVQARVFHLDRLRRAERSPKTVQLYGHYEQRYLDYLEGMHLPVTFDQLTPDNVEDCREWLKQGAHGARGGVAARRMFVTTMKVWASFLWRRKLLPDNPLAIVERPRVAKVPRQPFSEGEARALVGAIAEGRNPVLDRALFLLLADTGCRVGELCGLELSDVMEPSGAITGWALFRHTKNGQPRNVCFRVAKERSGGPCVRALAQWLRVRQAAPDVTAVFVGEDGYALTPRRVYERFQVWARAGRVENAYPHRMRHTSATQVLAAPGYHGAENQLRDRLGHVSKDVLRDYVHQTDPSIYEIAEVASLSTRWHL